MMSELAPPRTGPLASVVDLAQVRLQRAQAREHLSVELALHQRVRYRYVKPQVIPTEGGWLVRSPCCSRNVDPQGGDIDIAWLQRESGPQGEVLGWQLHCRDHRAQCWRAHTRAIDLQTLLDVLCLDPEREFWP